MQPNKMNKQTYLKFWCRFGQVFKALMHLFYDFSSCTLKTQHSKKVSLGGISNIMTLPLEEIVRIDLVFGDHTIPWGQNSVSDALETVMWRGQCKQFYLAYAMLVGKVAGQ